MTHYHESTYLILKFSKDDPKDQRKYLNALEIPAVYGLPITIFPKIDSVTVVIDDVFDADILGYIKAHRRTDSDTVRLLRLSEVQL